MAPVAAALEMAFKMFDIYDAAAFIDVLRGAPEVLADFLETDNCQALLAATAGNPKKDVGTETESAAGEASTTTDSLVATADVGSQATYSLQSGVRHVSQQVQCSPHVVVCGSQATPKTTDAAVGCLPVGTTDRGVSTTGLTTTADKSTSHYLVLGIGLANSEVQTEECVAAASDFDELSVEMVRAVEAADAARSAAAAAKAELDGLITAIINRKKIHMCGCEYEVWCHGEAGEVVDLGSVYVLPTRPLVLG